MALIGAALSLAALAVPRNASLADVRERSLHIHFCTEPEACDAGPFADPCRSQAELRAGALRRFDAQTNKAEELEEGCGWEKIPTPPVLSPWAMESVQQIAACHMQKLHGGGDGQPAVMIMADRSAAPHPTLLKYDVRP